MLLTGITNFSFNDLDGKTVSISDFKGKNTLIFMWASW
ncbi:TlpA family protein disulfide reductase [Cytobacillus gottheilii]|nr:redoxin domain-containing protein [Cytobacillus gottheilii]